MFAELCLPDLDLVGVEVTVCIWHVAVGHRVSEGDRLVQLLAGDVTVDLPAPASGSLAEKCVESGEALKTGQVLARIRLGG